MGGAPWPGGLRWVGLGLAPKGPVGFLRRIGGAGPPLGVVEAGPEGGPAGDALILVVVDVCV